MKVPHNQRRTFAFASVFNYAVEQRASREVLKLMLDFGADPSEAQVRAAGGDNKGEMLLCEAELRQRLLQVCSAKKGFPFKPQRIKS